MVPSLPYPFQTKAIFRAISQCLARTEQAAIWANIKLLTSLGSSVDEMCSTPACGGCPWCNENFFHPSSSSFFFVHLCKKKGARILHEGPPCRGSYCAKVTFLWGSQWRTWRKQHLKSSIQNIESFFFYVASLFHLVWPDHGLAKSLSISSSCFFKMRSSCSKINVGLKSVGSMLHALHV